MPRHYIYLKEDEPINTANYKTKEEIDSGRNTLRDRGTELSNERKELFNKTKTNLKNTKDNMSNMRKMEAHAKQQLSKAQQSVPQGQPQANSATILDEENDDASIVDNKSKEELTDEMDEKDIKNEKQPLKEFVSSYKGLFLN